MRFVICFFAIALFLLSCSYAGNKNETDLLPVISHGKCAFIDHKGEIVFTTDYEWGERFFDYSNTIVFDTIGPYYLKGYNRCAVIDHEGHVLFSKSHVRLTRLSNDYFEIDSGEKHKGVIKKDGHFLFPCAHLSFRWKSSELASPH